MVDPIRRLGFTLVESILVIAVIALFTAILLPVISRVQRVSRTSACAANLHQLGQAIELYSQDNEHYPRGLDPADKYTPEIWKDSPYAQGNITAIELLPNVMKSYVHTPSVWQCPSDFGFDIVDITGKALNARPSCYDKYGMSYFYHTEISFLRLDQEHLAFPVETIMLVDGDGLWHGSDSKLNGNGRRYNALFADGHVKNVDRPTYDESWQVPLLSQGSNSIVK